MSPVRKGTTALFISKINKPVTPSSSAIHSEGSVFHCGAGVVLHAAEVRFVTGSSQQGTWIKEAWFTEHITGVKPATNYPHQWPMLGDCGFKAAPSAGAKDVYGRKIFKAAGCWKKKKKRRKASRESLLLNENLIAHKPSVFYRMRWVTVNVSLQCTVHWRPQLKLLCNSVITDHRGAAPTGMTDEAATQHGGGGHQQGVKSGWDTFTFYLENWNRTLRCKNPHF